MTDCLLLHPAVPRGNLWIFGYHPLSGTHPESQMLLGCRTRNKTEKILLRKYISRGYKI